ncbi:MAG TPA: LysM peptidoglycan-binding domain-containing protein [Chloroflexi bacterium]|nr:LysM peptidoglycan-binding domain-containing protein [Chloroflexota bacterium]
MPIRKDVDRISGKKARDDEFLAKHTVGSGDSLSKIAQTYYESGAREAWMRIYEANKETIGDDPSLIKPGMVLKIPKV